MTNIPTLTLGATKKKEEKVNIAAETQAKQAVSHSKNNSNSVKQTQSANPQSKKLTPQERKARSQAKYAATFKKLIKLYGKNIFFLDVIISTFVQKRGFLSINSKMFVKRFAVIIIH